MLGGTMRDTLESFADISIRRACAFVGLGVAVVMLALSFDMVLALRIGAEIIAFLVLGLALTAWRAPRRNLRHSEVYALLRAAGLPRATLAAAETQALLAEVLRERLLWHAERVGCVACAMWLLAFLLWLVR